MDWASVIDNPFLRDLPFKIELDRFGQILMSPASNRHGRTQARLVTALDRQKRDGEIITECSVETADGVRVADVALASAEFVAELGYETPYPRAPEVCVEIVSPSNSKAQIEHKIGLYLGRRAQEVWIVEEGGEIAFYAGDGRLPDSRIVPGFTL